MRSRWCPLHQFWNFMCQFDPGGLAEFPLRSGVRLGSCIQAIGYSHNPRYFSHFILFCVYRMLLRSCQHPFLALASLPEASSNDSPWIYIWQRNWGAGYVNWACIFHFALHLLSLVPQRILSATVFVQCCISMRRAGVVLLQLHKKSARCMVTDHPAHAYLVHGWTWSASNAVSKVRVIGRHPLHIFNCLE